MIAIPTLFRKLENVKNLVIPLFEKYRSRTPFDSQHFKVSCKIYMRVISSSFFIIMGDPNLENSSLSDSVNPRGVS